MEKYLLEIKEILLKNTGLRISEDKNNFLISILNNIISKERVNIDAYVNILRNDLKRVIELATHFTVQETSFYRNKDHFNTLKDIILPELKTIKIDKTISILSAGCATGEEPYTIAMIIDDFFGIELPNWKINIYALDISNEAIEEAQKGIYTEYKMKNIDRYYIDKYFDIEKRNSRNYYKIRDRIKEMVTFYHENLLSPRSIIDTIKFDVIFCENVIIYFDYSSTEKLMNRFYNCLNSPGYLFLGYSETLNMIKHDFNLCWHNQTYYYSKDIQKHKDEKVISSFEIKLNDVITDAKISYENYLYHIMKTYLKNDEENFKKLYIEFLSIYQKNPDFIKDEKAFLIFGEHFIDINDFSNARKMCEMALEKNPASIDAHNLNAYILLLQNDALQSLFSLNISHKSSPDNRITLYLLYKAYENLNNEDKKRETIQKLKSSKQKDDETFFPYNSTRKIQFYTAINKIIGEN